MSKDTTFRALHDLGLAAWFGSTLAGAAALNSAASAAGTDKGANDVASKGWVRLTPVNAVAIAAYTVGGYQIGRVNVDRVHSQRGVGVNTQVKTALTLAAFAATGYSRVLGQKVISTDAPSKSGTQPSSETPADVAAAQKKLKVLQWAVPVLVGGIIVSNALHSEQQRPLEVLKGVATGKTLRGLVGKASGPAGVKETAFSLLTGR